MTGVLDQLLSTLDHVDLRDIDKGAHFLTRADRKYIVGESDVAALLEALPVDTRVLETAGGRWGRYESTYFDTPALDSYHLAAYKRPTRFKVRTRRYVDSDLVVVEIKTKDRRGRTVKHRDRVDVGSSGMPAAVSGLARRHDATAPHAEDLRPTLTNSYVRATLVLPENTGRVTIDAGFMARDAAGRTTGLGSSLIVETKTSGKPSDIDRSLWRLGFRPTRFSKYTTALAALDPDLPANRWHRVVRRHLEVPSTPRRFTANPLLIPGHRSGAAAVLTSTRQGDDR